jgi:hypothetical protein
MKRTIIVLGTLLAGCISRQDMQPIVDMTNVDQQTYNKDISECNRDYVPVFIGNPIRDCMEKKGYKILSP